MDVDQIILILCCVALVLVLYLVLTYKSKADMEYEQKLKESLADEFIIDPDTGAKITLEQAESGHWVAHDNEFRGMPEADIDKLYTEEEREAHRAINYLKESREYLKYEVTDDDISLLDSTNLLSQYDDWGYTCPYRLQFCDGVMLLPTVEKEQLGYRESQILFWVRWQHAAGHYYFREKSSVETFFDRIRNDDDIKLTHHECFSIEKTVNKLPLIQLMKRLDTQKGLEFEFKDGYVFIKSTRLVNRKDLMQIEGIVRQHF
ncbi:hypothetical protein M0G43_12735 [Subsaxibacter sp. CAU 1640]|uniref:hypothetical protein n=1 Tax=Subsaxibacter sp. CAU 1640 TaxID=2933271 RepID=UPI0020069053|nr:hypothetical protein [Subsaxibacter sp. CAU 1640]MCK7591445.1 hypothetical protein [Subsaxibacter sp. CAU 1640]